MLGEIMKIGKITWADLIVLAGGVALEEAGSTPISFCPGRTDATDGSGSTLLKPGLTGAVTETVGELKDMLYVHSY